MSLEFSVDKLLVWLENLMGRRVARIVAFCALGLGAFWGLNFFLEQWDKLSERFTGTTISWALLLDILVTVGIAFGFMVLLAVLLTIPVVLVGRWFGVGISREEMDEVRQDLADIKAALDLSDSMERKEG